MVQIICNISMFDLHQQILLADNDSNTVKVISISNLDDLSEDIATACAKYAVENVSLKGNKNFANKIIEEICAIGATRYGMNNIKVEVI